MAGTKGCGEFIVQGAGRWVHVGRAYLYVDADERIAITRAPWKERVQARELAIVLRAPSPTVEPHPSLTEAETLLEEVEGVRLRWSSLPDWSRWWRRSESPALAKYADALLAFLKQHVEEGRSREALRLASLLVGVLLYLKKWLWMVEALGLARQAAENLGDAAETAWVLHDLGALAVAAGVKPVAGEALEQAKGLRAGRRPRWCGSGSGALSQSAAVAPSALAVAAGVTVVAVAGVVPGFFVGGGVVLRRWEVRIRVTCHSHGRGHCVRRGQREPRSGRVGREDRPRRPPPMLLSPASRWPRASRCMSTTGSGSPGSEAETTSSEMSVDGSVADTRRWDGTVDDYTVGSRNYNGSGGVSSGDPIPYGRWELVVRIEGVEADRAAVTILESCWPRPLDFRPR